MIGRHVLRYLGRRAVARYARHSVGLAGLLRVHSDVREELLWEAAQRLDAGQVDEARVLYLAVLQLWMDSSLDATLGLAACAEHEGDPGSAVEIYDSILEARPENLLALANRAGCHQQAGRIDAARADLDAAERALGASKRSPTGVRSRLEAIRARLGGRPVEPSA